MAHSNKISLKLQMVASLRQHLLFGDEGSIGLGIDLARRPARKMPEILEERFGRAKSGLRLAPAKYPSLCCSINSGHHTFGDAFLAFAVLTIVFPLSRIGLQP
jgi:hypothetical protein